MRLSEHELVTRARHGDAEAFAALIEHYERFALAIAYAHAPDAAAAGDAVQDAFLRAWQQIGKLEDPARFAPWLMQIVRNAAIDLSRRAKPVLSDPQERAVEGADPVAAAAEQETAAQIRAAIDQLEESTRSIVLLRYYQDLSTHQIAAQLGLSPGAVDMRLTRGRQELRRILGPLLNEKTLIAQR